MLTNSHPKERSDQDATAPVSPAVAATMFLPPPGNTPSRFACLRKSNPADVVTPLTRKWLGGLPQDVRPINLIGQYPRIVNLIAAAWDNPTAFGVLATDLLYDFRGNRAGFSAAVVRELRALRGHYYFQSLNKSEFSKPRLSMKS